MPKREEKIETIIIQDQEGTTTTPNKTNQLGATRIRGTRTPRGQ
jgi:hypothetical protein